ncbi:MAG: sensor histidine kinase [Bdellovibrionia bacterium]
MKQQRQSMIEDFERIFLLNQHELIGNLMLGHQDLLKEQLKILAQRESLLIELSSPHGQMTQGRLFSDSGFLIRQSFPIHYAGQTYGEITLSRKSPMSLPKGAFFLFILGQFLFFSLVIFILFKWAKSAIVGPFELLVKQASGNYGDLSFSAHHFVPVEVQTIAELLRKLWAEAQEKSKQAALAQVASQVAHDIRSPLMALEVMTLDEYDSSEEKRIVIRGAMNRIKDIVHTLLQTNEKKPLGGRALPDSDAEAKSAQLVPALIEDLVAEKRVQYRTRHQFSIDFEAGLENYGLFSWVQPVELKRVLSNLVDNSVEALDQNLGRVAISLEAQGPCLQIRVRDDGKGISSDLLPQLMQRGATFGKPQGLGLGLFHAKQKIESWGGRVEIFSKMREGTEVLLELPRCEPPSWFVPQLDLRASTSVVILDDDHSIHHVWKKRFQQLCVEDFKIEVFHFSSPKAFKKWMSRANQVQHATYLFDFEFLGEKTNGLQLIQEFHLAKNSILITSRYEEKNIRDECHRLGISIIPKGMAGFVPIEVHAVRRCGIDHETTLSEKKIASNSLILIDDDPLVQMTWRLAAQSAGVTLHSFTSSEGFFQISDKIDHSIPIYIDSQLNQVDLDVSLRGEWVARDLAQMGFQNIYLTTGYSAEDFSGMPWLRAVRGKEPPFQMG